MKMVKILGLLILHCQWVHATVLWAGSEDMDFPVGASISMDTGTYRAGYQRATMLVASNSSAYSNPFPGGSVTSVWVSAQIVICCGTGERVFGLAKSGTSGSLVIGVDSNNPNKLGLYTFDGNNQTEIASETGNSISGNTMFKVDMQVINYGASATVNVYTKGSSTPAITYTGNVAVGGATSLDQVVLFGYNNWVRQSEIIVANTDTRGLSLVTLSPNAAGDTNQWTNTYTNVASVSINDAINVYDNTSGDLFEAKFNSLPSGSFSIPAVIVATRSAQSGTGGLTSLSVGVKTNGSVSSPAAVSLLPAFNLVSTLYSTNPVTTSAWTVSDINALQICLKSAP